MTLNIFNLFLLKLHLSHYLWTLLELDRWHIYPIVYCPDCEDSRWWHRLWALPIVYWISHIWRFYYEHNYIKVAQLRPTVTKMVTGSINWVNGNRILFSLYHSAYWKLHNDDKKCLVCRGVGKEGQVIRVYYHVQSRPGIMVVMPHQSLNSSAWVSGPVSSRTDTSQRLNNTAWVIGLVQRGKMVWSHQRQIPLAWPVLRGLLARSNKLIEKGPDIKDRYRFEPCIVLHGWWVANRAPG